MSDLLARFRNDFLFYAPHALKIRTKSGQINPFVLNTAQVYIHHCAEKQLAATGKVRINLLKGRQQGACLAPDTPVLTADLRWIPIAEVNPGQELVAVDEDPHILPNGKTGKGRKMRTATVEAVVKTRLPAYRITLSDGRTLVCSGKHRWLVRNSQTQWEWRTIEGSRAIRVGWKLRNITQPWGEPTVEDGWLGGMVDGEGSFERRSSSTGIRLAVSQRAGAVLDRMTAHCEARGYGHYIISDDGPRKTKFGRDAVHAVCISSMAAVLRLFGLSRPSRFIERRWWDGLSMPDDADREIVSIEPVGDMDLVDIQTSTGTFIANGLVSHNSTYVQGRYYHRCSLRPGLRALVLTHLGDSTTALFEMAKRYHELAPDELRPHTGASNANELLFDLLDSGYVVATAGNRKGVGRGRTFQLLHASEFAFWADAANHLAGLGQTVPDLDGSEMFFESTANGVGNTFHQAWQAAERGEGDYINVFVPWFWQTEYRRPVMPGFILDPVEREYFEAYMARGLTMEAMVWRRAKLSNDFKGDIALFDQEYPASPALAFSKVSGDPLIPAEMVTRAMALGRNIEGSGPKIMGVDPAEYGDDTTGIITRQGRRAGPLTRLSKYGPMEIVGKVASIADREHPDAINVDATGVGSGVADRLTELGYPVNRIHFGGKPVRDELYVIKRDEIWGDMKEWLEDQPNQLPADDSLASDLCAPQYSYDSSRRLRLESKETMRKRGVKSPDGGDALALTFATPFASYAGAKQEASKFRSLRAGRRST